MSVTQIPKLTMQQQVDTCRALLDLDDLESAGLVAGFGGVDRNKCLQFLSRAKRKGYVPGQGSFAIGKGFLEHIGGEFIDGVDPANDKPTAHQPTRDAKEKECAAIPEPEKPEDFQCPAANCIRSEPFRYDVNGVPTCMCRAMGIDVLASSKEVPTDANSFHGGRD